MIGMFRIFYFTRRSGVDPLVALPVSAVLLYFLDISSISLLSPKPLRAGPSQRLITFIKHGAD